MHSDAQCTFDGVGHKGARNARGRACFEGGVVVAFMGTVYGLCNSLDDNGRTLLLQCKTTLRLVYSEDAAPMPFSDMPLKLSQCFGHLTRFGVDQISLMHPNQRIHFQGNQ